MVYAMDLNNSVIKSLWCMLFNNIKMQNLEDKKCKRSNSDITGIHSTPGALLTPSVCVSKCPVGQSVP